MLIHEMTEDECRTALERVSFGRLACARDNQPYVLPIYFSYDGKHLYGFSTLGQKIEWMRSNPLVCLEIDERTSLHQWMSVVVSGRYEELPDAPEYGYERVHAHEVLQKRAMVGSRLASPLRTGTASANLLPHSHRAGDRTPSDARCD